MSSENRSRVVRGSLALLLALACGVLGWAYGKTDTNKEPKIDQSKNGVVVHQAPSAESSEKEVHAASPRVALVKLLVAAIQRHGRGVGHGVTLGKEVESNVMHANLESVMDSLISSEIVIWFDLSDREMQTAGVTSGISAACYRIGDAYSIDKFVRASKSDAAIIVRFEEEEMVVEEWVSKSSHFDTPRSFSHFTVNEDTDQKAALVLTGMAYP